MQRLVTLLTVMALVAVAALIAGCAPVENALDGMAAKYDKPLVWMNISHKGSGAEMLVGYRLPPPPAGQVYVVWALTKDHSKTEKLAVLTDGSPNGKITAATSFVPDGAMISVEDSPNVTKIGENRGIVDVGMQ